MVTKVGSAGHVVDSVIQNPYGHDKAESKATRETKSEKNKRHERVVTASEIAAESAKAPVTNKNNVQKIAEKEREALSIANSPVNNEEEIQKKSSEAIELSQEAIKITVDDVNKKLAPTGTNVQFSFHEKTGRYSFKVLDSEGNIVREVPPEKSLDMVAKMFEMVGILVDEKL